MKWNTQRKAVVAVLALAGAAFCVDRFVLGYGGPQTAAAVETTADILAAPDQPARTAAAAPQRIPPLSRRLSALAMLSPGPELPSFADALSVPPSWVPRIAEPEKPAAAADAASAPIVTAAGSFAVSSVFLGEKDATTAARINGILVRVGQTIQGHKLVAIERGNPSIVVLSGPAGEIRLPFVIGGSNTNPGPDAPAPAHDAGQNH